jgi:hypothetical protein
MRSSHKKWLLPTRPPAEEAEHLSRYVVSPFRSNRRLPKRLGASPYDAS